MRPAEVDADPWSHRADQPTAAPLVDPYADTPPPTDPPPADDREPQTDRPVARKIELTPASAIRPRPVFWLWEDRIALGTLSLCAGREGVGKSTVGYWIAARITRGELPGEYFGQPRSVLICATEDSWEHTIVPRVMAHDADLDRIFRIEVISGGVHGDLVLPRDLEAMERSAPKVEAAFMLLDPLMSRLDEDLDTHKDGHVRRALEPLVAAADRSRMAVLGLIHHNKSGSTDPLQLVMASKAFTAVARSVHTVIPDPDDDTGTRRIFGTSKNNLGRNDLPSLTFTIASHPIPTDEGTAWTSRVEWGAELDVSISETMRRSIDTADDRGAAAEAANWLEDFLISQGGQAFSADAKKSGHKAGHTDAAMRRARERLHLIIDSTGFPRVTTWELPSQPASRVNGHRGDSTTTTTDTTTETRGLGQQPVLPVVPVVPVASVVSTRAEPDPTAAQGAHE